MNGIGLLVLIAGAGQLNTGQPFPAQLPAQPFLQSQSTAVAQNRDWGWEFDKENTLCYIIQIPEQKLREMIDTGWELPATCPKNWLDALLGSRFALGRICFRRLPAWMS